MALKLRRAEERFIPQSTRATSFKRWLGGVALETQTLMMTCNRTTKGGKKRLLRFLYQGHDKLLQISDQCIKGILVVFAYVGQIRSRNKLLFTCVPKLGDQILMACESLPHGIIWTAKLIFLRTIR